MPQQTTHDVDQNLPADAPKPNHAALNVVGLVAVVASAAFAGWLWLHSTTVLATERDHRAQQLARGVPMVVARVTQSSGKRVVTLPGEVRPLQAATLYAKLPGYLQSILVDKGDRVEAGQILGRIESPETEQQLLDAETSLLFRRQVVGRYKSLVHNGVVSAQQMDEATAAEHSAKASVERVKALMGYAALKAPFAGVVTGRYVDAGALLPAATSSTGSAQPVLELQDMRRARIWVYLAQQDAPYVANGDKVTITSRDRPDLHIEANVTRTTRAMETRSRTMLVEIELDNAQLHLTPGAFLDVSLDLEVPRQLQIPSEALLLRGGKAEAVVVENDVAHYRSIQAGSDDGKLVTVLAGLRLDEQVGLHPSDAIEDGVKIRAVAVHDKLKKP